MSGEPAGPRRDARWWGWGDPNVPAELDKGARAVLREAVGELTPSPRPSTISAVTLPPAERLPRTIAAAVGEENVSTSSEDRVRHAAGKGYADLVRLRSGHLDDAPDAIVSPGSTGELARVLDVCVSERIAVVPFGGGTSVVGGVEPLRGPHARVISLDLVRLRGVDIDSRSLTAQLGAGLRGPEAEAALGAAGMTLGHFPQSFEYATIGGFAATRSAGQSSSGYGRFDSMVSSVRMVTPAGTIETGETPHTAAGPALRELVIGSEGVLGVIPDVTVRIRPVPRDRVFEGWFAESFEAGSEIIRTMAQSGTQPDVIRLSDEEETRVSLQLSGPRGASGALFKRYLGLRRRRNGCLMIVGVEGEGESVARRHALAGRVLRSGGAVPIGRKAGRSWEHGRYSGPYMRDTLMDAGAMVETLETAHTWTRLGELYKAVGGALRSALEAQGTPGLIFCHISHAYADGASLYFTFISRARSGAELEQWASVKTAACEAIVKTGGTITHHHAVGADHAAYMPAEVGELGLEALRAVKDRLDPAGVMNPGKLLG